MFPPVVIKVGKVFLLVQFFYFTGSGNVIIKSLTVIVPRQGIAILKPLA